MLPGPSTLHSSPRGRARRVPAFPPAPSARLLWDCHGSTLPALGTGDAPRCKGAARPAGEPRRGEGEAPRFPCAVSGFRSCVCSPRWVPRLVGIGLLGRSGPRARDASAKLRWWGRGASCLPCSVPLEGVPAEGRWKGWGCWWAASWAGASRVPWPQGMPAASLGGVNTTTAQETEGRVVPHARHP